LKIFHLLPSLAAMQVIFGPLLGERHKSPDRFWFLKKFMRRRRGRAVFLLSLKSERQENSFSVLFAR
jgi:hypothetical protein